MNAFRRAAFVATVATLTQIASGGIVRATGSGDGCPDWPTCFGRWLPPLEYHALIEWSHRFIGQAAIWSVLAVGALAVWRHRRERTLLWLSVAAVGGILVQAALGAIVVASKGPAGTLAEMGPSFVTLHITAAMALAGVLVWLTVTARRTGTWAEPVGPGTARLARASAAGVLLLIVIGAAVRGGGAGLAFTDWPLMGGRVIPPLRGPALVHFLHRTTALAVGILLALFIVRAVRENARGAIARLGLAAGGLYLVQALVGAAQVWTGLGAWAVAAHVSLSALVWTALVAATACARAPSLRVAPARTASPRPVLRPVSGGAVEIVGAPATGAWETLRTYIQLTKPRIILLLLVTTIPTMVLAAGGMPSLTLVTATVAGGTLAAAAANTFNCYIDRDIDSVMSRTRRRPLPAQRVEPRRALGFGFALAVASFALLVSAVNLPAALLAQAAILFYVFVYTIALKRSTPHNIVIGGAAGAAPVLVGWAAVTGRVGLPAVVLAGVVFLWTPPHFWALALRFRTDYERAGVPMLPVVAGARATHVQILWYAIATVAVTLVLVPVADMGALYVATALTLGGWLLWRSAALLASGTGRAALALFRFSIVYLAAFFAAVGLDAGLRAAA